MTEWEEWQSCLYSLFVEALIKEVQNFQKHVHEMKSQ
jgi:hypothetical protein